MKKDKRGYSTFYDSKKRFASYWHQIDEVRKITPDSVLEIGAGSGFVRDYLKKYVNITSFDLSAELDPDCCGSVTHLPFRDETFEAVLCCQVLEHLPFDDFVTSLRELARVSSKKVVLSLPDKRKHYTIQLPGIGKKIFSNPFHRHCHHEFDGQHYWEVNAIGTELEKVLSAIREAGFRMERNYQVQENYKHRFFILSPGTPVL